MLLIKKLNPFKIRSKLKNIIFVGFGFTLILSFLSILLISNIVRVVNRGRYNYEVYIYELSTLNEIKAKNEELASELEYVESDEFKRLTVRDILGYASENELIFRTKDAPVFYTNIDKKYLDVSKKESFTDWWLMLLK